MNLPTPANNSSVERNPVSPPSNHARVLAALLVVHSDSEAAGMLMALRRGGFSVRHMRVSDQAHLRQELARTPWDVVITANRLPSCRGVDILRAVQSLNTQLPVILVYGDGGAPSAIDAIREGAHDCIHKNELADQLAHSVRRQLDQRQQRLLEVQFRTGPAVAADRAQQAMAVLPIAIYECDATGCILGYNPAAAALWGREAQIGHDMWTGAWRQYTPDGQPVAPGDGPMAICLRSGDPVNGVETLIERPDNTRRHVAQHVHPLRDADGHLTGAYNFLIDLTEQRRASDQARLARNVLAAVSQGVLICGADRRILSSNQAFVSLTGYAEEDLVGSSCAVLQGPETSAQTIVDMQRALHAQVTFHGDILNYRKDGSTFWNQLTIDPVHDEQGRLTHSVGILRDVTAQRAAQEKIDWLSHFDPLTQLPNRELLALRCAQDLRRMQHDAGSLTMIVVDIDRFKLVNEILGFAAGNEVIKEFAHRLTRAVRAQDTVARLGADEFALLLPGETPEGASQVIERLQASLSAPFEVGDQVASVCASVGVAIHPNDGDDFESLFKAAQTAMHLAKAKGGNQHRFHSAAMSDESKTRQVIGSALRSAIQHNEMHLVYQPFVDLQSGRIVGMEALLRWTHPELGVVSPAVFIPVAEQSGHIVAIGAWVLRQACLDITQWRAQGLHTVPVSVNLSPLQFRDPGLLDKVRTTLQEFAIESSQICLELTEGAIMDDVAQSELTMRAFKEMGVSLSLDDFGTGYSSLGYLKRFPFEKVKIDQSFVRDINTNSQDAVIASVVISMAHGLGLRVIAEGVETESQCEFLRRNACDEIQGYLFSRPIPAPAMADLLQQERRFPTQPSRLQVRERTMLLVDNEPQVVVALKRLLRPDGYRVLSASSGPEGLAMLAGHPVDIIVADQCMTGMTIVQFLREVKSLHPASIRIVLSSHTGMPSMTEAVDDGSVYCVLTKPWDDGQLRGFIEQAFRHKSLADENDQLSLKILTATQELTRSKRHLREVLAHQQRVLERGAHNPDVPREALMSLALPVLAIDDEGVISFANARAEDMFGTEQPLLSQPAAERLPRLHALVGHGQTSGPIGYKGPDGNGYKVQQQIMGHISQSRGTVITFTPTGEATTA